MRGPVQEIWLIRREGDLLYRHPDVPHPDAEYLAVRLAATHRFVSDSFSTDPSASVSELAFGDRNLAILGGRFLVLAVLVSGRVTAGLRSRMEETLLEVERAYADVLSAWAPGRALEGLEAHLAPLLG